MSRRRVLGDDVSRFRAAVIGNPVGHSLSPRIHEAAYAALGLDWCYGAFDVEPRDVAAAVREADDAGFVGLSVTTPLKFEVAAVLPGSNAVGAIGAANTIVFGEKGPWAHNTDGDGLLDDLSDAFGFDAMHRRCGIIGAGATARAIVRALDEQGVSETLVVNRSAGRALAAASLAPKTARVGRGDELGGLDLVVYAAKPAVPGDDGELAAFASGLSSVIEPGQLVVDVNYHPLRSAFLDACEVRGAVIRNGIGMLVHQAARQVELFTGSPAPLAAMWGAVGSVASGEATSN